MKVLHVIPSVAPRYGGTSTFIRAFCRAMAALPGLKCEVASTDTDGKGYFSAKDWDVPNVPLHLFRATGGWRGAGCYPLRDWLKDRTADYDLIHSHTLWNYSVFAARRAAENHRIPLILSPHGMLSHYSWTQNPLLKRCYWWLRERYNVTRADSIHCASQGEAAEVRKTVGSDVAPVHVVPLGVDCEAWTTPREPDELRRRCGVKAEGKPIILFLSRLHPTKGIVDLLLPAFARLKTSAFLAIAGGVDDSTANYPKLIRSTIATLGLTDRVTVLGSISSAERWGLFDGAAAFVLPSHHENFGFVVAEAMARGLPVVISDQVQIAPWVREANGFVVERDPGKLADALDRALLRSRTDLTASASVREYARERFNWALTAQKLVEVYLEATNLRKIKPRLQAG